MKENLKLIEPTSLYETEFREMATEWKEKGDDKFKEAFGNFATYIETLRNQKKPDEINTNIVPGCTYWLIAENHRILGTSRLRYWLLPHLEKEGGHIGYDIRPLERRNGYGTRLLALTLIEARNVGLKEVLITCDRDNLGSVRIIEKNDGEYIDRVISDRTGKQVNRYRIVL